jgi:alpha-tubulin suppressor-like RCC1 family protein
MLVRSLHEAGKRVVDVAAGSDFSVALCDSGEVVTWGAGDNGRLGHGHPVGGWFPALTRTADEPRPRTVSALRGERVAGVFAGVHSTGVTLKSGGFALFGSGRGFALGNGLDGDVWEPEPVRVSPRRGVKLSFGLQHTLFAHDDGSVFACGDGDHGALGVEQDIARTAVRVPLPAAARAVDVAAGWGVSMAAMDNGDLLAWGCGAAGVLGRGDESADCWTPEVVDLSGAKVDSVRMPSSGRHVFAWRTARRPAP